MIKNSLYVGVAVLAAFLIRVASVQLTANKPVVEDDEDVEVRITPKKKSKRTPASVSVSKPKMNHQGPSRPQRMVQNFEPRGEEPVEEDKFGGAGNEEKFAAGPLSVGEYSSDATYNPGNGGRSGSRVGSITIPKSSASSGTKSGGGISGGAGGGLAFGNVGFTSGSSTSGSTSGSTTSGSTGTTTSGTTSGGDSGSTSSGGSTGGGTTVSCNAVSGGGSFSIPVSVAITCDGPANIEYCITSGPCSSTPLCDPSVSGTNYSAPITIGATDGEYCLSYFGTSTASGLPSAVADVEYKINSSLPDLQITHDKIYYQTTEIAGLDLLTPDPYMGSYIASTDFGLAGFGIGQINLKHNDPGSDSCEDIVTNYVSYPLAPTPASILAFMLTNVVPNTSQVDIPLALTDLTYGDNFITSYIKNSNYTPVLYSCSTTKVKLEDFDYFQSDSSHGDPGTDTVREFAGGFVAYGFFEPTLDDVTPVRGPAGESSEDQSGEKLETGIFSIFY